MSSQNYVFQDNQHDTEHIRLSAIQDEFDPDSRRRLSQIGITAGWSALEVGAGMGSIMSWMADQVSVQGKVVAVDIDTRFIENTNLPNVEVRCLDIAEKKLDTSYFDVCHARYVLLHIRDWKKAIENIWQSLKPGGWLVIEEPDFETSKAVAHPDKESVNRVNKAILAMYESMGIDPCFGSHLPQIFQQLGSEKIMVETYVPFANGGSRISQIMKMSAQHLAERYIATGVCLQADIERYIAVADDPSVWAYYYTTVATIGRKSLG
ncbi:methyltransferase domain-containing protein [Nostoc flagelliforme FACHB-838]|uniref:Methyltransferase domain-containing protein n=1 Tax=Nostoc flagelliforme FACHB-838 TaxID=2692904 RepID=A0ABR8E5R2_9NOSO|nr:methyltransferase domain-containing protein [Nostoc flagelliforme]MBD2536860.1 methyltransferase domain-containing protein [Nostoc flagelliforme FACHB-838]